MINVTDEYDKASEEADKTRQKQLKKKKKSAY